MRFKLSAFIFGPLVGTGISLCAQTPKPAAALPPLGSAQPVAEQIFHRTNSTGMIVVVVRGSDVWMASFGQVAYDRKQQPGPDSLVRLCSITKILTTDVLAKLVADAAVE